MEIDQNILGEKYINTKRIPNSVELQNRYKRRVSNVRSNKKHTFISLNWIVIYYLATFFLKEYFLYNHIKCLSFFTYQCFTRLAEDRSSLAVIKIKKISFSRIRSSVIHF